MNRVPPELKEMMLRDIVDLDKYCLASKQVRVEECPRLYAALLWNKFKLRVNLGSMRSPDNEASELQQAHMQIMRIRATYFAEESRLTALDRAIEDEDVHAALLLMQFNDTTRDHLNINYVYRYPSGVSANTLLDTILSGYRETNHDQTDPQFTQLLETVHYLVGSLGAAVTSEDMEYGGAGSIGHFVKAVWRKTNPYDPVTLQDTLGIFRLLMLAGGGPMAPWFLDYLTTRPQAIFSLILQNMDKQYQKEWLMLWIPNANNSRLFPWRLFDRDLVFMVIEESFSTEGKLDEYLTSWPGDPMADMKLAYRAYKES